MSVLSAALMMPFIGVSGQSSTEIGGLAHLNCTVALRDGSAVWLAAELNQTAPSIHFASGNATLPVGGKVVPLTFFKEKALYSGSINFDGKWLNLSMRVISRAQTVTEITFNLESEPSKVVVVELNSLYGVAICNVQHSDTQS